jgi:hypothetical protein
LNICGKRSISYARYNIHFLLPISFFLISVRIKLSKTHIYFPSLSTYAIIVPFLSTIYPSIHPSNDTKRLDAGDGMHYTITDSTIASKYTHTHIYIKNEITHEILVFFLTRQVRFCLYMKQNTVLKEKEREGQNTDITLDYEKKEKEKRQTHILKV